MTIICPSCDARFRDPPAEVPADRPLQCSKCEHEWQPVVTRPSLPVIAAPGMAPDLEDLRKNGPNLIRTGLPVIIEAFARKKQIENQNEIDGGEFEEEFIEPRYFEKEPDAPATKSHSMLIALSAFALLTTASLAVHFRDTLSTQFPQTAGIYHAVGLNVQQTKLTFENVITTRTRKDGIRQLIVRGEIENVADNTVPVPPIKLIMRDRQNADLYAWTVSASKSNLKAGERSRFTAIAQDYPEDAEKVEVEFTKPVAKEDK